jgi:hypothetical protein
MRAKMKEVGGTAPIQSPRKGFSQCELGGAPGLSNDFFDYSFWLSNDDGSPDFELEEWVRTFLDVDQRRNPNALIDLLKPLVPASVAPHLADFLEHHLRKSSTNFRYYSIWLRNDNGSHKLHVWVRAFLDVDLRGDPTALIDLLKPLVPPRVAPHLADLLEHHLRKPRKRGTWIASYDRPPKAAAKEAAVRSIRDRIHDHRNPTKKDQAIAEAALFWNLDKETLTDFYEKKQYLKKRSVR